MNQNPYQPGVALNNVPRTCATRWLIWSGLGVLGLAATCLLVSVAMLFSTFNEVASATASPRPSDLANGIRGAVYPLIAVAPLGLLGMVLLVVGTLRRQPVENS